MVRWLLARWQWVLVVLLFLASFAALIVNSFAVFLLPQRELEARDRLRAAVVELAAAGKPLRDDLAKKFLADRPLPDSVNRRLAEATERVLADYSGTEGGFYLNGRIDQFAGFAHPDGPHPDKRKRRDPPPLETPSIRRLSREALAASDAGTPLIEVRDVGPSRVAIATVAVPRADGANGLRMAAWVMVRLVDPEQQRAQLGRYRVSAAFALGGILLGAALMVNLSRSLRQEKARREQLSDELRRAEQLAVLGGMLAGVAHEVRNPLAAIRSTVQLWQRLPDEALTPASLNAVVSAVDRLNDLVSRLLLFARGAHEERRAVDLNSIVAETLELSRAQAEQQGVVIEAELEPALPAVAGSAQGLRQVVMNLAANALQAMPNGGRLHCRTRSLPSGRVELVTADTGSGVPAEVRSRLFEPFFTTRPDGTGLGLALCREIVAQHGGQIALDRDTPIGATFRVTLPIRGRSEEGG